MSPIYLFIVVCQMEVIKKCHIIGHASRCMVVDSNLKGVGIEAADGRGIMCDLSIKGKGIFLQRILLLASAEATINSKEEEQQIEEVRRNFKFDVFEYRSTCQH